VCSARLAPTWCACTTQELIVPRPYGALAGETPRGGIERNGERLVDPGSRAVHRGREGRIRESSPACVTADRFDRLRCAGSSASTQRFEVVEFWETAELPARVSDPAQGHRSS
jgi:hypothetical protein